MNKYEYIKLLVYGNSDSSLLDKLKEGFEIYDRTKIGEYSYKYILRKKR